MLSFSEAREIFICIFLWKLKNAFYIKYKIDFANDCCFYVWDDL